MFGRGLGLTRRVLCRSREDYQMKMVRGSGARNHKPAAFFGKPPALAAILLCHGTQLHACSTASVSASSACVLDRLHPEGLHPASFGKEACKHCCLTQPARGTAANVSCIPGHQEPLNASLRELSQPADSMAVGCRHGECAVYSRLYGPAAARQPAAAEHCPAE